MCQGVHMLCKNKNIKDLLPAYVGEDLDQGDLTLVEEHLRVCADCAQEAALLRMMADEPVPDPGEAFWAAMPGRVYHAVQQQDKKGPQRNLHALLQRMILPRWAWAAAAAGIVLAISWFIMHPVSREATAPALPGEEYSYEDVSSYDVVHTHTSANMDELTSSELDAVDAWTATELSAIALEAGTNVTNVFDTDLNEELAELNSQEAERLSKKLEELEEG